MISRVFFLFLFGVIAAHLGYAQKLPKVKKPNMKVYINITRDTLTMKFHRPNQSIKLEGFILGYGSNYFTNQYIQWPDNGKSFITDVEAEARYLIAVKPNENHKTCKEKNSSQKPLQLVIGTLTPTSVYLSWGILINPQVDWSALSKCPNDRFYTVRYREKNKDWNFQLCPTTETVVDNLKPNTAYEFCVKDNSDDEIWSKPQNHKTSPKGKENGNIENTYKIPKGTLQYASEDTKALIPVMVVKQGFQNITKSTAAPPPTVQSTVFREKTKRPPLTTTRPPTPKPKPASKVTESLPVPKTSEKTIAEDPKPAVTSQTIVESFTPDSSTGTLEWVRAASPTISPVSFTKELPILQPETVLASDELATYVPQPMTISHIIPDVPESNDVQHVSTGMPIKLHTTSGKGMHPKSTLVSKLSTHLPYQKHTSTIGDVPESIDVQQVSTDMPIKLGTTSYKGMRPKSTLVSKLSTHLPFQKHTSTIASPTIFPVSFTKELPIVQTVLASEPLATYVPQPITILHIMPAGEESISSEVPQLQSSTVSSHLLPEPPRTIAGKGMHPKTTLVSKLSTHLPFQKHKTTIAAKMKPIYGPTTISSLEKTHTYHATTSQFIPGKQSTMSSKTHKKPTEFIGNPSVVTTPKIIVKTTVQHPMPVPNEILSFHPKPVPSTEAPESEADSTLPESKIITTDAPHIYEPEKTTLASDGHFVVQKHTSTAKSHTAIAYRTTTTSFSTNTPTTSQRTQSTLASKKQGVSPAQPKIPLPKKTQTTTVPDKTQKIPHKKDHSTVGPTPQTGKTEKDVSSKPHKTSQSPPTTAVPKPAQTAKMPINLIRLHIYPDPALPSVQSETQTTAPPIPKTTQSNKIPQSKPAPKTIKKVPIHVISIQIFDEPDVPMVLNTTLPPHSTTTQRPETPHTTPVPVQKVPQPITQKPKSSPRTRTKPAPTAAPKETTTLPKIPHVTAAATLATYRVQHSSSRPRTSLRPRTRPGSAQNGTTQGSTGDFNWVPGTIPGGRVLDSTKLLGVSRNISMEPNNTGKKTFSVSSPPLPPVKPTSLRRRIQYNNVTGRPRVTVSSPPLPPVKPTTVRRRPPTNVTARPIPPGCVLISRASSAPKLNCTVVYIKPPKVQPTLPATDEDFVDPTVFNISPKSDVDTLGKPRFTGPHVKYINKEDNIPCSITESLKYFPTEESTNQDITAPPQNPPSNLTVVTVEGCPSFVILDWGMPDNDTATEFTVISTENGAPGGKNQSIITTNQTYSTVENLKPDTKYDFKVVPTNPLGEGPASVTVEFSTESADPRVSEPVSAGKDAIWTEIRFKSDSYSECRGKQYVKRTWYKKFVGIQLCNSLRYKIYLSNSLTGTFYNIGDQSGYGEDHCQFVDSFLDGRTGQRILPEQLTDRKGFYRSVRQQPVEFGDIGGRTHTSYVHWYECGIAIPGKW
ncbi:target of Nesh-SH3 isoform X45 [Rana temporaria]|uniref:target of Nesh-SH3 isoform X45 n=1 Tax=Rana temporaria TaxID=8407 RepID=UPI001AAC4B64|nr:target of Nesh-SH3 isoform X45 [Rana temporaria]